MGAGSDKHYERWFGFESLWIVVVLIAIMITITWINSDAAADDEHGQVTAGHHAPDGSHGAH